MSLQDTKALQRNAGLSNCGSVGTSRHVAHSISTSRIWDYVSASRLNLWLRCPKAFELRYVHGVDTPTTKSLFFGKQIHAALENFYRIRALGHQPNVTAVLEELRNNWNEAIDNGESVFEDAASGILMMGKAVRLIEAYVSQIPADEPLPLAVETTPQSPLVDPVSGEDMGMPILGIVDLILDDSEGPVICDQDGRFVSEAGRNHARGTTWGIRLSLPANKWTGRVGCRDSFAREDKVPSDYLPSLLATVRAPNASLVRHCPSLPR